MIGVSNSVGWQRGSLLCRQLCDVVFLHVVIFRSRVVLTPIFRVDRPEQDRRPQVGVILDLWYPQSTQNNVLFAFHVGFCLDPSWDPSWDSNGFPKTPTVTIGASVDGMLH